MDITLSAGKASGTTHIPSSKSQTIRALLIAAMAEGTSIIRNPLYSADTRACMKLCEQFGAHLEYHDDRIILTSGTPSEGPLFIDCGNSGTTLYLGVGLAARAGTPTTFTGDSQLRSRPVGALLSSLADLGASITDPSGNSGIPDTPPFTITGPLKGGTTSIISTTSQYLSGLLIACTASEGDVVIEVPLLYEKPYVGITLDWLDRQNISYTASRSLDLFKVPGGQRFSPFDHYISGDFSSASFFFCAAAVSGTSITVTGLDRNDPQGDKHILDILSAMGCAVSWNTCAVTVTGPASGRLRAGSFDLNTMPDALPVLAVAACFADGTVTLGNVPQARIKETDRIAVMYENLSAIGACIEEKEDGLTITGSSSLRGGIVSGHDDHRIIMAMAIASLRCSQPLTIQGIDAVSVTFPSFFTTFHALYTTEEVHYEDI
ncbi:3-phosphoshikimate 1-carboxyvinyltransferase [Parasphaerochaeta coccoides]|uniref:3-phosphoshikimate 1-carboxyvinyltransferase n=1 Tax=Parasphaerochaeta coccoides (strain ATCC BAA-1237 / DSM 17374 / SPN1) TaxID=760011 RepID=F4GI37_PARC1|nr:3-phosphoshikimate 1-carboxyvinyltransferase [Parasphaerochaeta coccoides]AEC02635.1 3-phosphoshikimate 1-carboxyvinyltransferase [Parasphaerochaeta coccoides DSM 17374]